MTLFRGRSRLARAFTAFTALATSWCLGCSAFEVLVDAAAGGDGGGMVCASDKGLAGMRISGAGVPAGGSTIRGMADDDASSTGMTCGCEGCFAPSPVFAADVVIVPPPPIVVPAPPVAPPSADRSPLVPPPQVSA